MYIYIIRHGETEWNKKGLVQGKTDIPLNETGIKQAERTSFLFNDQSFDALITSPLKRAITTGNILTKNATVSRKIIDDRIIEKCYGITEGWNGRKRYEVYPNGHAPQEESYKIVRKRMFYAIQEYAKEYTKNILVVSHGSAIAALIKELEPTLEKEFLKIENLSLTIIDSKSLKLIAWNLDFNQAFDWFMRNK